MSAAPDFEYEPELGCHVVRDYNGRIIIGGSKEALTKMANHPEIKGIYDRHMERRLMVDGTLAEVADRTTFAVCKVKEWRKDSDARRPPHWQTLRGKRPGARA